MKFYKEVYKQTISPEVRDYGDHLVLAGFSLGILTVAEMRIYPNDIAQLFLLDCSDYLTRRSQGDVHSTNIEQAFEAFVKHRFFYIDLKVEKLVNMYYDRACDEGNVVAKGLMTIALKERLYKALLETSNWLLNAYSETPDSVFAQGKEKVDNYFNSLINQQLHKISPQKFKSRPANDVLCSPTLKEHEKIEIEIDDPKSGDQDTAK